MRISMRMMPHTDDLFDRSAPRQPTTVTLNADLLAKAQALGIDVSLACEGKTGTDPVYIR